jgi:hypothetical protein
MLEAMSVGAAILPRTGEPADRDQGRGAGNARHATGTEPHLWAVHLLELAGDRRLLDRLRREAYDTALSCSLDLDTICDRYALLIGQMLHELRAGSYCTPAPLFLHPAFGGRSLPPALQLDPDRFADAPA